MNPTDEAKLARLEPSTQRRLRALLDACPFPVGITSGYRSRAEQQQLYDRYKAGTGAPANRPGSSPHEKGRAADLRWPQTNRAAAITWAHDNAQRFGLRFPYSHEPWHTEHNGAPHPLDVEADDLEDDMTDADRKLLTEVHAMLKALTAPRRPDRKDVDISRLSLADVYTAVEALKRP